MAAIKKQDGDCQTRGFKTAVHKPSGGVTVMEQTHVKANTWLQLVGLTHTHTRGLKLSTWHVCPVFHCLSSAAQKGL